MRSEKDGIGILAKLELFNYDIYQIQKIIEGQKSLNDLIINKL